MIRLYHGGQSTYQHSGFTKPFYTSSNDISFLNIHNPFTNERISIYLDKHNRMSLDTKNYFVKQISYLSKGVVIVA